MAKTPKTLQVSFGRFSCSLEGFDDPIHAMKSVTEYLRDLSARDPAFATRIGLGGRAPEPPPVPHPPEPLVVPRPPEPRMEAAVPVRPAEPWPEPSPLASPGPVAREPSPPAAPKEEAVAPRPALEVRVEEPDAPAVPPRPEGVPVAAPPPAPSSEPSPSEPSRSEPAQAPASDPPGPTLQDEAAPPPAPEDEAAEEAPDLDPAAHPGLQKLRAAAPDEGHEEEMSRFLLRADDQLADPEATRRRDVIAQLKAAVVATEAERALGDSDFGPEARKDAFRLDLSEAVRLHPPVSDPRPDHAPLRLVASQRVDAPPEGLEEHPVPVEEEDDIEEEPAPVRSRASFAVFATEMGATSLPDLLEAAAAWLCFVDELESVSRSQLLALAAEVQGEAPDREEGLRTFGTLLRQGRIAPVAGGRYRISEGSRFDPSRLAG